MNSYYISELIISMKFLFNNFIILFYFDDSYNLIYSSNTQKIYSKILFFTLN
jgi:hypothetical protein